MVSSAELRRHGFLMEQRIAVLEGSRDLSRIWIHVDMDAFFASCEELVNPALVGRVISQASAVPHCKHLRMSHRICLFRYFI